MTLAFIDVYDAAKGKRLTAEARRCLDGLKRAEIDTADLPALRGLRARLLPAHASVPTGEIVIAILRAHAPKVIVGWVALHAPHLWSTQTLRTQTRRLTTELYGDCFLALDRWHRSWEARRSSN